MALILVVDDRPGNREYLVTLLRYRGHRLLEAGDGAEALALVRAERPDLVITDVLMPTMDGFEFVRRLRADPDVARTPVIFYSAEYQRPEAQALARASGVVNHVTKPAEPEEILRVVEGALGAGPAAAVHPPAAEFDREHLRLLTDTLARRVNQLEAAQRRQAVVADLGQRALSGVDPSTLMDGAVALVARALDVEYCHVLELLPEGDALRMRAGVGWEEGRGGLETVGAGGDSAAGYALRRREPVFFEDLPTEGRFGGPPPVRAHGVTSGVTVAVPGHDRPFGVLGAYTARRRTFTRDEGDFLLAVANVLASAVERRRAEEALREGENRTRERYAELDHLYRTAPVGLGVLDRDLRFVRLNERLAAINGGTTAGHVGRTLWEVIPDLAAEIEAIYQRALESGEPDLDREVHGVSPTDPGVERDWLVSLHPLAPDGGAVREVSVAVLDVTERKRVRKTLEVYAERLRELTRRLMEVQEAERRHLARELHDEIGQALTAVKINLQGAMAGGTDVGPRLGESVSIIDETLQRVRGMALDLRPSLLDDLGLVAALEWYVERHAQRTGLQGRLVADPDEIHADPEIETACFRVAQEALTNVARHARASRFSVELIQHAGGLLLVVRDDGVGFDPGAAIRNASRGKSLGLAGMRERVELVGGRVEFVAGPGEGAEVRAEFPTAPAAVRPVSVEPGPVD